MRQLGHAVVAGWACHVPCSPRRSEAAGSTAVEVPWASGNRRGGDPWWWWWWQETAVAVYIYNSRETQYTLNGIAIAWSPYGVRGRSDKCFAIHLPGCDVGGVEGSRMLCIRENVESR